jgi:hypothetical protein
MDGLPLNGARPDEVRQKWSFPVRRSRTVAVTGSHVPGGLALQRKVKILWRPSWSKKIEDRVGLDMKMFFC